MAFSFHTLGKGDNVLHTSQLTIRLTQCKIRYKQNLVLKLIKLKMQWQKTSFILLVFFPNPSNHASTCRYLFLKWKKSKHTQCRSHTKQQNRKLYPRVSYTCGKGHKAQDLSAGIIIILGLEESAKIQQQKNTNPSTQMDKAIHSSLHNAQGRLS